MAKKKMTAAPGATEIASWQSQLPPKPGGTVSGSPDLSVGANQDAVSLYNLDPKQRSIIATSLKKAGYKVPVDGSFGPALLSAYLDALSKSELYASTIGKEFDPAVDLGAYLSQTAADREALAAGGKEKITAYRERVNLRPESINATIDTVFNDLLGRAASDAEKAKYLKRIQKKMAKTENMQTTRYQNVGGGMQERVTTQAFSPEQYLINEISGTDEAKQQQVMGYYDAFKRALGVM